MRIIRHAVKSLYSRSITSARAHGPTKGDRVVVAMSGGVDSSAAALILAQEDYDLSAVYMRNWDTRDESGSATGCEWERDWDDVQGVCRRLGLPCQLVDFSHHYWTDVFQPALEAFEDGLTPNPDIWCNREIKFGRLMEQTVLHADRQWLATGHYAAIAWSADNRPRLMRPRDRAKDQTFFLASVSEDSLRRALFPLGSVLKSDVREMARRARLPTARREESMGLCFVGERRRFTDFLSQYLRSKRGNFVDSEGTVLAEHAGIWRYTIGQGAKIRGMKERMFVAHKDPAKNEILVVPGTNHPALYCKSVTSRNWKWIAPGFRPPARGGLRATVQIRRLMAEVPCTIDQRSPDGGNVTITFTRREKAVAPGQVAVLWDRDWCLGCGTISETSV